ncbi:MAG: hypothetical protein IJN64_15640 [Lachnospiraceae bacterium]|nr:hypothetical protein [Lachnospiraceae bacterium]
MEKVIVFGHGRYYKSKKKSIEEKYQVCAFLDNLVKSGEVQYDGDIPIYNPLDLDKELGCPILIMSVNFYEMCKQLIELGVHEKSILFAINLHPYWNEMERILSEKQYDIKVKEKKVVLENKESIYSLECEEDYKVIARQLIKDDDPYISYIAEMPLKPVSRRWGLERGKAVDRYYIEKFLEQNKASITGEVMEIAENTYTYMFGENVSKAYALHVNGWGEGCIKGNLESGEGIIAESVDCLICTQTMEFIFDCKSVVDNIYRLLRKNGTALITVAGIRNLSLYDYYNWGEYWRFTAQSLRKLFLERFDEKKVDVFSYGNIKTTFAMLYGVCQEEMQESDFEYNDEQFPLILAVKVIK